jgi:phosphomannomutase
MRKIWAGIPGLTLMLSNEQPNGFFPLGVPDPLLERTMERTQKLAEVTKAALSLAFDGDADRIGAVINTLALTPTELGALIAEELIRKSSVSAPAVLYTIACSKLVSEVIRKAGGRAVMGPVGYGHLRARMQKMTDCIFALEHSGHMIYREFFGADCGMVSAGMIFRLVARQPDIAKRVRQWRQQYHISKEESFSLASQEAITSLINELESDFSAQGKRVEMYAPGEPVPPNILRVELAASGKNFPAWFLVRPSGNEPLVRLMAEVIIPRTNPAEIEVKQARRQLDELLRTLRQKIKNAACRDAS